MKETITIDMFAAMDLRVGTVLRASVPEWSQKLLELTVDFGPEVGHKTILTGVKEWYSPEDLQGNTYIFVINLAERKMGQGVSQGMILMAEGSERPVPLILAEPVAAGATIR